MYMYHIIPKCNTNTKYRAAVRISNTTTVTKYVLGKQTKPGPGSLDLQLKLRSHNG